MNKEYDWDNIDKQGVFSQNGLSMPIGDFERIGLDFEIAGNIRELKFHKDFENFFSDRLLHLFTIEKNGKLVGIGDISFDGDIITYIKNDSNQIEYQLTVQALNSNGIPVLTLFSENLYANNKINQLDSQKISLKVVKEDIPALKNARNLRFSFTIRDSKIEIQKEDNNYIDIVNMRVISTGGIAFNLDSVDKE